jgi:hypothetical protein
MLALALAAGLAGYLTADRGERRSGFLVDAPPKYVRGVVQSVDAGGIVLTTEGGALQMRIAPGAPVEVLGPITPGFAGIAAGEWLNGGAIFHAQTQFALVGVVVIPTSQLESPR